MIKSDKGKPTNDRDQKFDRLMNLLGEVSLISKELELELVHYLVGMAFLEAYEQNETTSGHRR